MLHLQGTEIVDCTLRDGGFQNGWWFDHSFARDFLHALAEAGIHIAEVGYFTKDGIFPAGKFGPWRYLNEEFIVEMCQGVPIYLCAMGEVDRFEPESLPDSKDSLVKIIRVASFWHQISEAINICKILHEKGYFVCLNLVAASTKSIAEIEAGLGRAASCAADALYIVDTYGALGPKEVARLVGIYQKLLPGKRLGIHAHNNRQLALANTLTAVDAGVDFVDCTLQGIGRGVGNCPLEALLGWAKGSEYSLVPILRCLDKWMGKIPSPPQPDIKYLLTAMFNEHHKIIVDHPEALESFYDFLAERTHL